MENFCSRCKVELDEFSVCGNCGEDYSDMEDYEKEEELEEDLNHGKTVFTGWKTITPGKCFGCGFDNDWQVDGRGNVLCGCQACVGCGILDAYGFHNAGCPQVKEWEEDT